MCCTLLTVAQQSYNQGRAISTAENSNISFPPRKKKNNMISKALLQMLLPISLERNFS